ncbi:unnamed protein product [Acanthosepion pharaonis]|uniref:Uncharacterized protein n=1 Tax=Acanthosepion pharaonis TaxID=158019 RepID=A0A812BIR3_ACAPH|nr:unnamed protein product [Sepia pharaonis]
MSKYIFLSYSRLQTGNGSIIFPYFFSSFSPPPTFPSILLIYFFHSPIPFANLFPPIKNFLPISIQLSFIFLFSPLPIYTLVDTLSSFKLFTSPRDSSSFILSFYFIQLTHFLLFLSSSTYSYCILYYPSLSILFLFLFISILYLILYPPSASSYLFYTRFSFLFSLFLTTSLSFFLSFILFNPFLFFIFFFIPSLSSPYPFLFLILIHSLHVMNSSHPPMGHFFIFFILLPTLFLLLLYILFSIYLLISSLLNYIHMHCHLHQQPPATSLFSPVMKFTIFFFFHFLTFFSFFLFNFFASLLWSFLTLNSFHRPHYLSANEKMTLSCYFFFPCTFPPFNCATGLQSYITQAWLHTWLDNFKNFSHVFWSPILPLFFFVSLSFPFCPPQ